MPKQSTRHRYKSRRERNKTNGQRLRLVAIFALIIGIVLMIRSAWKDWAYWATYFNDL
jgi:hypothetical protein